MDNILFQRLVVYQIYVSTKAGKAILNKMTALGMPKVIVAPEF